jgi:hypothetical protein
MSCCSTVFFGANGMALARRLALRRSGFAWRFKSFVRLTAGRMRIPQHDQTQARLGRETAPLGQSG